MTDQTPAPSQDAPIESPPAPQVDEGRITIPLALRDRVSRLKGRAVAIDRSIGGMWSSPGALAGAKSVLVALVADAAATYQMLEQAEELEAAAQRIESSRS